MDASPGLKPQVVNLQDTSLISETKLSQCVDPGVSPMVFADVKTDCEAPYTGQLQSHVKTEGVPHPRGPFTYVKTKGDGVSDVPTMCPLTIQIGDFPYVPDMCPVVKLEDINGPHVPLTDGVDIACKPVRVSTVKTEVVDLPVEHLIPVIIKTEGGHFLLETGRPYVNTEGENHQIQSGTAERVYPMDVPQVCSVVKTEGVARPYHPMMSSEFVAPSSASNPQRIRGNVAASGLYVNISQHGSSLCSPASGHHGICGKQTVNEVTEGPMRIERESADSDGFDRNCVTEPEAGPSILGDLQDVLEKRVSFQERKYQPVVRLEKLHIPDLETVSVCAASCATKSGRKGTELFTLREQHSSGSSEDGRLTNTGSIESSQQDVENKDAHPKRLSNGSIDPDSDVNRVIELQDTIEKQNSELSTARSRLLEVTNKCKELEDSLTSTQKDLMKSREQFVKLQRNLRDSIAQRDDQEERIATLEKRYLNGHHCESTSLQDLNDKLESELHVAMKKSHLNSAKKRQGYAEKRLQAMEQRLSEELERDRLRENMNEEHNTRLSATVDRLVKESNEQLQLHLKERREALEEKKQLTQELDRIRKILDETQTEKKRLHDDLQKSKRETESLRQQMEQYRSSVSSGNYSMSPGLVVHNPLDSDGDPTKMPKRKPVHKQRGSVIYETEESEEGCDEEAGDYSVEIPSDGPENKKRRFHRLSLDRPVRKQTTTDKCPACNRVVTRKDEHLMSYHKISPSGMAVLGEIMGQRFEEVNRAQLIRT